MTGDGQRWAVCGLMAGALGLIGAGAASAQAPAGSTPSQEDQLLGKLTCQPGQACEAPPPSRKRGLGAVKRSFEPVYDTEPGRAELLAKAQTGQLPSADVEVTFDFNSDVVGPAARQALAPLGNVLNHPRLAGSRFALIGHTDAKGRDAFNQALSERRAAAVKRYLVSTFGIAPERLGTFGRGRTDLKRPDAPLAGENRRVQVVNGG